MDWRIKCLALHALARARWLHRIAERVTGSGNLTVTDSYLRLHRRHAETYRRVHPGRALEFGGGRHFLSPLLLSEAGATEILVYDLERLTSPEQINHTIRQLKNRLGGEWPEIADFDDLHRKYRIRYLAPSDARDTGLPAASVDFVCSTNTLEHIPPDDIRRIFAESARIARRGAIFSHAVDYMDHFSYADRSVSQFNFYRYTAKQWRWLNPPNHYQNRLRHTDYERLFAELPLAVIDVQSGRADAVRVELAPEFRHYELPDLLTHSAYFVHQRT